MFLRPRSGGVRVESFGVDGGSFPRLLSVGGHGEGINGDNGVSAAAIFVKLMFYNGLKVVSLR